MIHLNKAQHQVLLMPAYNLCTMGSDTASIGFHLDRLIDLATVLSGSYPTQQEVDSAFAKAKKIKSIWNSGRAPALLPRVARNETCSSFVFMQKDNPGIFKPRD